MAIHFIVTVLYFNVVCSHVRHCLGMGGITTSWELPFPDIVPRFVLRFLYTCFVVPAREGFATFHVVRMLLLLTILLENG